jgi:hypothetical protein
VGYMFQPIHRSSKGPPGLTCTGRPEDDLCVG